VPKLITSYFRDYCTHQSNGDYTNCTLWLWAMHH